MQVASRRVTAVVGAVVGATLSVKPWSVVGATRPSRAARARTSLFESSRAPFISGSCKIRK